MNRSFRAEDKGTQAELQQQRQLMGSLRTSIMKEKDEDLALFLEMRKREKERNNLLLLQNSEEEDASFGSQESSPIFNIGSATAARKIGADDILNSENDKNDYEWLLTPPGTPLFPSLEMESPKTMMSQLGALKARPTPLKSRLANPQPEPAARSNLAFRQTASSPVLNTSTAGIRRPSSSGGSGSRPATPTGRPALSTSSKSSSSISKSTLTATSKPMSITGSKPSRSATPTSHTTLPSSKPTVPVRFSTPTARSAARSSTPTERSTVRSSTSTLRSSARSSTPMIKPLVAASKAPSRSATPTRKPITPNLANACAPLRSPTSSLVAKPAPSTSRNLVPSRSSSPTVKPRLWKPSEIPGFSLDTPPNLRTSLPDRPISATRGRSGALMVQSSSIEPLSNGRVRRQSCSPARGRPPNGIVHGSGSSVPAMNRAYAKANDNVSPVVVGTKMVERVINMRKLAPAKHNDNNHSPHGNMSGKSSSPDSSGFGRTLSKKSLDMAIRHMDIRRRLPGSIRPSVTNIPASAMYSVRSGHIKSRTTGISDSPLATSSNGSSEVSVNNNALCVDGSMVDDAISDKGIQSPTSLGGL